MVWNGPSLLASRPLKRRDRRTRAMKQISVIGLDLAKQSFQVHGAAADGTVAFNRKLRRAEVLHFFEKTPPSLAINVKAIPPIRS